MKSIVCEPDNLDPLERRFLWSAWGKKSGYKGDRMRHFGLALAAGPMELKRKDLTPKDALRRSPSRGALEETLIIRTHTIEPLGITRDQRSAKRGAWRRGWSSCSSVLRFGSWFMGRCTTGMRIYPCVGVLRGDRTTASSCYLVGPVRYF